MRLFSPLSLRAKTIIIAMSCSVIALVISLLFTTLYQHHLEQDKMKGILTSIANVLVNRNITALQLGNQELAQQHLEVLSVNEAIDMGCLYSANGSLFAEFHQTPMAIQDCPNGVNQLGISVINDHFHLAQRVRFNGDVIGSLYLEATLLGMREAFYIRLTMGLVIAILASIIALIFAARLQRLVTRPIRELEKVTSRIRVADNYAFRAKKISGDEIGRLVDSFNDMLDRIEADNNALKRSEERFRTLTAASTVGIFQTDYEGKFEYVNWRWREITGIVQAELTQAHFLQVVHPEDRPEVQEKLNACFQQSCDFEMEFRLLGGSGVEVNVICEAKAFRTPNGVIEGFLGSIADVTELIKAQNRLKQLALYDSLTQLANRYLFRNRLEKALLQAKRDKTELAVFYIDIDHFKKINDTLGHDQGDKILCVIADSLKKCTRPSDTVARMGGDEFTILIPKVGRSAELDIMAHKFLDHIHSPICLGGKEILVSASVGIAVGNSETLDANAIMKNADLAMYRAKTTGRNNYQFFSDEMNLELQHQMDIEHKLRAAIDRNELLLYFQPQICIASQKVIGYEALLRWRHPERGLLNPVDFISIAEDTGLILPIGEYVIRQACLAINTLRRKGAFPIGGRISINLSAKQFHTPHLIDFIQACLLEYGVRPCQLELEITESLLMRNIENSIDILLKLNKLGITSSIDDFGTGYSSLNYLKQLPIQVLKVDQTFVKDIPEDKDDMEITAAIIAMAHKLGLKVIAEGVEYQSQVDFLKANQCDYVQGFFYGKPMPLEQIWRLEPLEEVLAH